MWFQTIFLILLSTEGFFCVPFLYNAPQTLANFASASSSAASSQRITNIANLRGNKPSNLLASQDGDLDEDDFFKEPIDKAQSSESENQNLEEEESNNEAAPSFIQKKVSKILQKLKFISMFVNSGSADSDDDKDDFDKEFEDFDKELEADMNMKANLTEFGYVYEKPLKPFKIVSKVSEKQVETSNEGSKFSPKNIGIFFMELVGSLLGLAYGAAAQLNYPTSTQATI